MKKILSILLVTMFTISSMVFAQATVDEPEYIKVTNKTTQKSRTVMLDGCQPRMGTYYGVLPDIPLGIYAGDVIEVSYGGGYPKIKPQLKWSYGVESEGEDNFATGLTTEITIPKLSIDNQGFWIGFTYQLVFTYPPTGTPTPYMITAENKVHNGKRFNCSYSSLSQEFRVVYNHYDEVRPYLKKAPYVTVTNALSGVTVFSGYMNDYGEKIFNTGGKNGTVIVTVTVDGVALPAERTYIW